MSNKAQTATLPGASTEPAAATSDLALLAQFSSTATQIQYTYSSLLMCMGRINEEENEVLVPFVETRIFGPEETEGGADETLFSEILTLDNAAYMLSDMCTDLSQICRQFRLVSAGDSKPEAKRLEATKRFLVDARTQLDVCISEMDQIAPANPDES